MWDAVRVVAPEKAAAGAGAGAAGTNGRLCAALPLPLPIHLRRRVVGWRVKLSQMLCCCRPSGRSSILFFFHPEFFYCSSKVCVFFIVDIQSENGPLLPRQLVVSTTALCTAPRMAVSGARSPSVWFRSVGGAGGSVREPFPFCCSLRWTGGPWARAARQVGRAQCPEPERAIGNKRYARSAAGSFGHSSTRHGVQE